MLLLGRGGNLVGGASLLLHLLLLDCNEAMALRQCQSDKWLRCNKALVLTSALLLLMLLLGCSRALIVGLSWCSHRVQLGCASALIVGFGLLLQG
jgi:hypothetical protein